MRPVLFGLGGVDVTTYGVVIDIDIDIDIATLA